MCQCLDFADRLCHCLCLLLSCYSSGLAENVSGQLYIGIEYIGRPVIAHAVLHADQLGWPGVDRIERTHPEEVIHAIDLDNLPIVLQPSP